MPSAGYVTGKFTPGETFNIRGGFVAVDGGFQLGLGDLHLGAGLQTRYAALNYTTNDVKKGGKWYYAGIYSNVSVATGKSSLLQMKIRYAPYSKLYVNSHNSLAVNSEATSVREYTRYYDGAGADGSIGLFANSARRNKYDPIGFAGLELGAVSQTFAKKRQRIITEESNGDTVDTKETVPGSYRLTMLMASFVVGVDF